MIKVCFICHGNICRSPMAEFILKDLVRKEGLEESIYIESCATSSEEIGNKVYPPVAKILNKRGIDCSNKRARRVNKEDYEKFDLLVAMDSENLYNLNRLFNDDKKKIHLLLSYAGIDKDIADPWYTRDFNKTYEEVMKGCIGLLKFIKQELL